MHKNTGICISVTENNIIWLYFYSSLHVVLTGCCFIKQQSILIRVIRFEKKPLPSHCPRQIGYTFHEPCPHGLYRTMSPTV